MLGPSFETPFFAARRRAPQDEESSDEGSFFAGSRVRLARAISVIRPQWQPKVIAEMNDYQFKVVKLQ
jgi:hypothetical protein